jgi:hypothetical protein
MVDFPPPALPMTITRVKFQRIPVQRRSEAIRRPLRPGLNLTVAVGRIGFVAERARAAR